jgi:hypothetical protein
LPIAPLPLTKKEARNIILAAQGFDKNKPYGAGAPSVSKAVQHLGYVQIDTISVVERAHHHVLWSRIPDYRPEWLQPGTNQIANGIRILVPCRLLIYPCRTFVTVFRSWKHFVQRKIAGPNHNKMK